MYDVRVVFIMLDTLPGVFYSDLAMTNATAAHIADCIIREANMLAAKRAARAAQKTADLAAFHAAQALEAALHDDRWVTLPSGARVRRIENYYTPIVPTVQDPNAAPIPW